MPTIRFLEVGVFEARAAVHLLGLYPQLAYTGIDSWQIPEKISGGGNEVECRARRNLSQFGSRVRLIKDSTYPGLMNLYLTSRNDKCARFEFVYIDAGHQALNVFLDSAICWLMLEVGGVMLWDDYMDRRPRYGVKRGADSFLKCVPGKYELLLKNRQMAIRKTSESSEHFGIEPSLHIP